MKVFFSDLITSQHRFLLTYLSIKLISIYRNWEVKECPAKGSMSLTDRFRPLDHFSQCWVGQLIPVQGSRNPARLLESLVWQAQVWWTVRKRIFHMKGIWRRSIRPLELTRCRLWRSIWILWGSSLIAFQRIIERSRFKPCVCIGIFNLWRRRIRGSC